MGNIATYDIIIIGAGIAGMTAAIYAKRAGKEVLILEEKIHGGQIINTFNIANWPGETKISGVDLSQKIYQQLNDLGVKIEYESAIKVTKLDDGKFEIKTEETEYCGRAVIIATGSNERKIEVAGEEKYIGRGVSYCATCDGAFYKDKNVAIVGGGNTAFYDALYLADLCKKIYLVHRRNEFRADVALVKKVQAKGNVEFLTPYEPVEVIGDKKVTGLEIHNKDEKKSLEVDGVFIAVGRTPNTKIFIGLVDLDDGGYIISSENCHTSCRGVFAAGDVRVKNLRQLVTAASDGAVAASEAAKYLG